MKSCPSKDTKLQLCKVKGPSSVLPGENFYEVVIRKVKE